MPVENKTTLATLLIINYNGGQLTIDCIRSALQANTVLNFDIIVVDNNSLDNSVSEIRQAFPNVKIIENPKNLGYAGAVNIGVRATSTPYAIVSNNDVIYHNQSLSILIGFLENNQEFAAAGPQQLYPDGKWQYSFGSLPGWRVALEDLLFISSFKRFLEKIIYKIRKNAKKVGYIDGAVMALRRSAFDSIGGFDEDYFFFTEEADYCKRLADAGFGCHYYPKARVTHFRGASYETMALNQKRAEMFIESKVLYCKKHLSKAETRCFITFELIHSLKMKSLYSALALFSKRFKLKAKTHSIFISLWNKYMKVTPES